jgi:exosortase
LFKEMTNNLAAWTIGYRRSLRESPQARRTFVLLVVFTFALLWCYAPTLADMANRWSTDPKYSHGFLVPVFAAVVLWVRRANHPEVTLQLHWGGMSWLAVAGLMRLASAAFYFEWLDALSLLPALAGVCVLLGGTPALRWAWPSIAFLVFMMPAPYQLEVALAQPLQRVATVFSTYVLQTVGLPAVAEGNVIWIDDIHLGVVEACSGLGMLITFFALSTAVALILARSWPERVVLFVSAVPIAVLTNVARITLTGILYATVGGTVATFVYHDLAGWLMMPLALVLLWLELKLLTHLFIEPKPEPPLPVGLASVPVPAERKAARNAAPPPAEPVGELGPL